MASNSLNLSCMVADERRGEEKGEEGRGGDKLVCKHLVSVDTQPVGAHQVLYPVVGCIGRL